MKQHLRRSLAILLIALAVRAAYLGLGPGLDRPLTEDEQQYDEIARNIVTHGEFFQRFDDKIFYSFRAPLYPFFVAGIYALAGPSPAVVIGLQALLDGLVAVMLYAAALRLFADRRAALIAALLWCVYPFAIHRSANLMTETMFAFILLATVLVFLSVERRARLHPENPVSITMLAVCGFGLGAATLAKAGMAPMGVLVVAWAFLVFRRPRAAIRAAAVVCGVMVVTLLPWTLRNWTLHKAFVPVATEGGVTLLGGNNERCATEAEFLGFWYNPSDLRGVPTGLSEVEESRRFTALALSFLGSRTDLLPRLFLNKFLNTWVIHRYYVTHGSWAGRIAQAFYTLLVPLWVTGIFMVVRRPTFLWMLLVNLLFLCLIFYGSARLRFQVAPCLILLAAAPLAWMLDKLRGRPAREAQAS